MPAPASVWPRLEPLLASVQKPIQYVGGELGSTPKEWESGTGGPVVRWALMYPDAYEVGLLENIHLRSQGSFGLGVNRTRLVRSRF